MAYTTSFPDRTAYRTGAAAIFQQMSLLARSNDAVNFAQGIPEPVYDELWAEALQRFAVAGSFQYTPSRGTDELRQLVGAEYGVGADAVVITSGCTEGLQACLAALTVRGHSHLIYVEPFYSMYPGMASLHRMTETRVALSTDEGVTRFDVEALCDHMRRNPRAVTLVNSPHNPTGATLRPHEWRTLADVAKETGGLLLVDDAYHDFLFDGEQPPFAELIEQGSLVVCGAASKGLAATGVRVGWVAASRDLAEFIDDAHMYLSYCTPLFVQQATVHVWRKVMPAMAAATRAAYALRAERLTAELRELGATVSPPKGGFFVCAQLPQWMMLSGDDADGVQQAEHLTSTYGFTPLPLDSFVADGHKAPWLRFAICTSDDVFESGVHLLRKAASRG